MKYSLILFLLLPFFSRSQDCNLKTSKDPYTKELKLSTGLITLNNGQYSIEATKSEIDFMFSLEEKCFDDASTASIFFEGTKTKTNLKNTGTMNCDGLFHFSFRNTNSSPSSLINLGKKKITAIRFKDNTNKETSISLTEQQQQTLMDLINCVASESKKLLQ